MMWLSIKLDYTRIADVTSIWYFVQLETTHRIPVRLISNQHSAYSEEICEAIRIVKKPVEYQTGLESFMVFNTSFNRSFRKKVSYPSLISLYWWNNFLFWLGSQIKLPCFFHSADEPTYSYWRNVEIRLILIMKRHITRRPYAYTDSGPVKSWCKILGNIQ